MSTLALLAGVPLFLCMPPWTDVTLYDMAARTVLRGGVYYRDVFDTNLPGISWAMALVRMLFGWSYEALRAVDLLVVAAEVALLIGWLRKIGVPGYTVAWFAAAVALYYPFTSEFSHVQRDAWMLLPALIAARLRLARVEPPAIARTRFRRSLLEGFFWGAAVWIKPHVIVPAFFFWATSALILSRRESWRRVLLDLGGLTLGGMLAGLLGVAWIVGTGAWPYFWEIFTKWNPNYVTGVIDGAGFRFLEMFETFRPWGLLHFIAIPLAALAFWEARIFSRSIGEPRKVWGTPWLFAAAETEPRANARLLLAVLYLGWMAQAIVFQKGFDYVQVPVTFLCMAMVASHRWAFAFVYVLWFVFLAALLNFTTLVSPHDDPAPGVPIIRLEHYPLTNPEIMRQWPRCWREGSTPELRDRLGHYIDIHCGTNWEELDQVAKFLRGVEPPLGPKELNCWHDSTHPLYLMLNLAPATRYMHYGTVMDIRSEGDWIKKRVAAEVEANPHRYVIADLGRMTWNRRLPHQTGRDVDPLKLPRWLPLSQRDKYPWNQELVFRSGRYLVFKVVRPLGEIGIPDWLTLDELGPGE